ncbi:Amastin surface glycoprotein [Novymonas esmeraldas]|uniref:Amastin surface glycoprotein n=1 Tax=Novymonas esmeraldas TaxID=1808958 RepID=A0AAW0EPL3_9TRYP
MSKDSDHSKDARGKTMPPSHHEPTDRDETGSSTEKPVASSSIPPPPPPPRDVLIGPVLFSVLAFISLVLTVVSIGIPWYRKRQYKPDGLHSEERLFYLFKHVTKVEGAPAAVTYPSSLCTPVQRRVRVMEAFAIASSVMTLLTFVLSVVNVLKRPAAPNAVARTVMLVFTAAAMVSLTVEVSFNFNVYLWSFAACGAGSSYHSQLYEPYVGFGLTVTAWVLTALGGIIAANELVIPLDARTVDQSIHSFTMLSLVAFLFAVVACPIAHWFYKDGTTNTVTDVLLWRQRFGNFAWNMTDPGGHSSLFVKDFACPSLVAYFRAAEAFSIASILFTMLAGVTGLLLWKSLAGSRLPALVFSYVAAAVTLVQLALELKIYYGSWCDGRYAFHAHFYVLSAGFGLVASAFCIMVVSCVAITVAYHLTERYFPALIPRKTARQIAVEECK